MTTFRHKSFLCNIYSGDQELFVWEFQNFSLEMSSNFFYFYMFIFIFYGIAVDIGYEII